MITTPYWILIELFSLVGIEFENRNLPLRVGAFRTAQTVHDARSYALLSLVESSNSSLFEPDEMIRRASLEFLYITDE